MCAQLKGDWMAGGEVPSLGPQEHILQDAPLCCVELVLTSQQQASSHASIASCALDNARLPFGTLKVRSDPFLLL